MIREIFIECIKNMNKAKIVYFSKKDQANTTRIIAPTDIGPRVNPKGGFYDNGNEKFRFYDFTGSNRGHMTPKDIEDIVSLEKINEKFSMNDLPVELGSKNDWFIERNWNN